MKRHERALAAAVMLGLCLASAAAQPPPTPVPPAGSQTSPPAESPGPATAHFLLAHDSKDGGARIITGVMKPFDVYLVAERLGTQHQMAAVAFRLDVPEGLIVVGEELLVESLLGLGNSHDGLNLAFRCVDNPRVRVLRFRMAATRVLPAASIRLLPDTRTGFLGVIACKDENYDKIACPQESLAVTVHP